MDTGSANRLSSRHQLLDGLHLAALGDDNVGCRPVQDAARILDLAHDFHAVDNLAEGYVLAV